MAALVPTSSGDCSAVHRGGASQFRFFRRSPSGNGKGAEWGAVVQRLISAGHRLAEVQDYSLQQIEIFLAAIDREDRAATRGSLIAARAANLKPDSFKRLLKEFG